jgi:hypothetical protein
VKGHRQDKTVKNKKTTKAGPPADADHESRVTGAFASLQEKVRDRLDPEARGSVDRLRDAASKRDAERLRAHLGEVRERHGWLYQELAAHPEISTLLNELALWGF